MEFDKTYNSTEILKYIEDKYIMKVEKVNTKEFVKFTPTRKDPNNIIF